jgi:protein gp37
MDRSKIEWTDATWNPLTGCDKVSPGCAHCYAEVQSARLQRMGQRNYQNGFSLTLHPHMLEQPLRWQRPRTIFVNSMSDLFHAAVPMEYIRRVFQVMVETPRHRYQVLTKRAERLAELAPQLPWPDNVWMGVSVENHRYTHRIDCLRQVPASIRFLSCEPLLGPLHGLDLVGIHWVIVGGESGPGARPMQEDWVRNIKRQCDRDGVAFFFKQWGGVNKKAAGRLLDGQTWDGMPASVRSNPEEQPSR